MYDTIPGSCSSLWWLQRCFESLLSFLKLSISKIIKHRGTLGVPTISRDYGECLKHATIKAGGLPLIIVFGQ